MEVIESWSQPGMAGTPRQALLPTFIPTSKPQSSSRWIFQAPPTQGPRPRCRSELLAERRNDFMRRLEQERQPTNMDEKFAIHNRVRETFVYVNRDILAARGRGSVA